VTDHWLPQVEKALIQRRCEVVRREADWALNLVGGGSISLPIPWRIIADDRIAFADQDDGQWFGLSAPLDGQAKANSLIGSRPMRGMRVDRQTLDLAILFEDAVRLDAFSNSSGYEGWSIHLPRSDGGLSVIAMGGGEVAVY
jgi:hypothetical protein